MADGDLRLEEEEKEEIAGPVGAFKLLGSDEAEEDAVAAAALMASDARASVRKIMICSTVRRSSIAKRGSMGLLDLLDSGWRCS